MQSFRYIKLSYLPFAFCCCNSKIIIEKNVIIFFKTKNNANKKELKNRYNSIHSKKGNILQI